MRIDKNDLDQLRKIAEDPGSWKKLDQETLAMLVFVECCRYGIPDEMRDVEKMSKLYGLAVKLLDRDIRLAIVQGIALTIEARNTTCTALIPVLYGDNSVSVISSAALSTAVLMPLLGVDPLTGPRSLLRMTKECGSETTQAGVLVGLLALGDRRVTGLIRPDWDALPLQVQLALASTWSGVAHAPVIDFFVDVMGSSDDEVFGAIAGTLARYPSQAQPRLVVEGERKMPVNVGPGPEIRQIGEWTFDEYRSRIAPKLRELMKSESEPKVIPAVLAAWKIAP